MDWARMDWARMLYRNVRPAEPPVTGSRLLVTAAALAVLLGLPSAVSCGQAGQTEQAATERVAPPSGEVPPSSSPPSPSPLEVRLELSSVSKWVAQLKELTPESRRSEWAIVEGFLPVVSRSWNWEADEPLRGRFVLSDLKAGRPPKVDEAIVLAAQQQPAEMTGQRFAPLQFGTPFRDAGPSLAEGEVAYAGASNGQLVLTLDATEVAGVDAVEGAIAAVPAVSSLPLATVDEGSSLLLTLGLRELPPNVRQWLRRQLAEGLRERAREQAAEAKGDAERRIGLELLRLFETLAVPLIDADEVQSGVVLSASHALRWQAAAIWDDDAVAKMLADHAPLDSPFEMLTAAEPLLQCELHLELSQRSATRLSRLVELLGQSVRVQTRREGTLDYVAPGLELIEAELLASLKRNRLGLVVGVASPNHRDLGVCFGLELSNPARVQEGLDDFLSRVGAGGGERLRDEATGVVWTRFPTDEENSEAQPVWTGYDAQRFWLLSGTLPPQELLAVAEPGPVDRVADRSWVDLRLWLDRVAAAREPLTAADMLDPAAHPFLDKAAAADEGLVRVMLAPVENRVLLDVQLPPVLVEEIAAQQAKPDKANGPRD